MVTILITSLIIVGILAIGLYFWQKPAAPMASETLLPPPEPRGLFSDFPTDGDLELGKDAEAIANAEKKRAQLLERAQEGDKSALQDARIDENEGFYTAVLNSLVDVADSDAKLLSLVSYVTRHELPVNSTLAERFIESWKHTPDRSSTAKMLHIAALSDDARVYQSAVENTLSFWRSGQLSDISAQELRSILEGEFWILSAHTRSSGAGFLLKRTLANTRRELDAAHNH